jgi:hypothetical protein
MPAFTLFSSASNINEEGDHQVAFLLCIGICQQVDQSTMAAIQPKITSGML